MDMTILKDLLNSVIYMIFLFIYECIIPSRYTKKINHIVKMVNKPFVLTLILKILTDLNIFFHEKKEDGRIFLIVFIIIDILRLMLMYIDYKKIIKSKILMNILSILSLMNILFHLLLICDVIVNKIILDYIELIILHIGFSIIEKMKKVHTIIYNKIKNNILVKYFVVIYIYIKSLCKMMIFISILYICGYTFF